MPNLFLGRGTPSMWLSTVVFAKIYNNPGLLFFFKLYKYLVRLFTNTTELYRICHHIAVYESHTEYRISLESTPAPEGSEQVPLLPSPSESTFTIKPSLHSIHRVDMSLLYSKELVIERREIESHSGNLERALERILVKKRFPQNGDPSTPEAISLQKCMTIISSAHRLTHELNARAATRYDPENKAHERKLLELWDLLMPEEPLEDRVSKQWQKIGFQGTDPATDFRGMGMLALDDLHYYAKYHPASIARVLQSSHHDVAWFSMAIVGINMTGFALKMLRTRQLQCFLYEYGTTKEAYHEFYCYLMDHFERHWTGHPTPITVMDFSRVFDEFQKRIQRLLLEGEVLVLNTESAVFAGNKKTD
ncbi:ELMO/CED-12 family-domain-containing protein [Polychytrium aggregatum]|uniref:ELMO/CED-12 family-domain-containing protein n=1 Tax=Polychytrium aggregatum TaxID=110093 RepID=UPI0022FE381F|nr:ELMO/CED-12 family-domain-containing protein [Polychytrium aggregatum]KAI9207472.1 ELMO/CED-12 family-domain-containing protein [Polychytrium aggregatum]